jgi:hypothetical protein
MNREHQDSRKGIWIADAAGKAFAALCLPFLLLYGLLVLPFLLLALPFMLFIVFVLLEPPHRKSQPCVCGRAAKFVSEVVREGEGRRSWTDLIIAEYRCPNGHTFSLEWTGSAWGD